MTRPRVKKVSLSGPTRLTYREAVAMLRALHLGLADMEADEALFGAMDGSVRRAIDKLKTALARAGGYDLKGNLYDPFGKVGAP